MGLMAFRAKRGDPADVARGDIVAGSVMLAAMLLLLNNGSDSIRALSDALFHASGGSDRLALVQLFLNLALIIFAWRRYRDARTEMSLRAAAEAAIHLLSSRDQLTSLLVRQSIEEKCQELASEEGATAVMLVLNLDRFKNVNDVYGHIAGDSLLRLIADEILSHAPETAHCARIGADEFCILLSGIQEVELEAANLADQLLARVRQHFDVSNVQIHTGASIGLAKSDGGAEQNLLLLRRANIAMHAAKSAGGNRILWFDHSMESVLKARTEVESGLRRGTPLGEFLPYYQPQVDLASGRILGFEALARWQHPAGGIVGPEVFIPVAEETGLLSGLFESVFHQALGDAKAWSPDVTLSVNISPGQLQDPWLAQKILKILTENGFPAERLEIEITESSLFENLHLAQSIVTSLKNQGVRLALDDFGTGYSSLANLRALPFDRIKIDRSFVQSMAKNRESLAIVTAITKIGESLGVPVTAEGVDSAEAARAVHEIGCDMGQGWYFGKPLAAEATLELVTEHGLAARAAPPKRTNRPQRRSAA